MRYAFRQSCSNVLSFLQDALSHPYHHNTHNNKSEEELFKRYNPDLQRRSLENRLSKQQDFDKFVNNLKEYSKSEKPSKSSPTLLDHLKRICASCGPTSNHR